MKGHGAKFPRLQERAIANLLATGSVVEAARQTGVGSTTMYRWLADNDNGFAARYREARRQVLEASIARIQQLSGRAVEALEALLGPDAPEGTRLRAAGLVLDVGLRGLDRFDLVERIERLEAEDGPGPARTPGSS